MKGHKGHHHGHMEAGVHHKHPRAEHKKGGKVEMIENGHFDKDASPTDVYEGANSNVAKEAKKRKHGGMAKHHVGHHEGHHAHHHAGRKPRKSGGAASGSNMHPLSSAHKGTEPKGHKSYEPEEH